jgi:phosphate transport system substrate-binding protein
VLENKFDYALVQNSAGKYPTPGVPSISAAAAAATSIPSGGTQGVSLTDPPTSAPNAYPISTFTYIIVPTSTSSAVGNALHKFIDWAVTTGQADGPDLDFAPLPAKAVTVDKADAALIK